MTTSPGPVPPTEPLGASPPTEPLGAAPPVAPAAGVRVLRRSPNRMFGGVAGGVADFLDTSPVLVRILFVLVAIFAGSGVLIYVLLWLLIPEQGQPDGALDNIIHRRA